MSPLDHPGDIPFDCTLGGGDETDPVAPPKNPHGSMPAA